MTTASSTKKDYRELFAEIDALCAEIDEAALDAEVQQAKSVQEVALAQDQRDRKKRLYGYAQLLETRLVEIEIAPFDSPRDRASLTVTSSFGVLHESAELSECFGLVEYLLSKEFSALATGKYVIPAKAREDAQPVTWFVLRR